MKIIRKLQDWMRSMKNWTESFAETKNAMLVLFILSFAESSFFPIPPDVLLIAIAVAAPTKSFKAALWCTLGSVFGGIFGYYIGYALMGSIGMPIVEFYQAEEVWLQVAEKFRGEVGFMFLAGAAFTPIPYKVTTIAAGATEMPLVPFILISTIGRGLRFFLVGSLLYFIGPKVKEYIDKYFDILSIAFLVLLVGGFIVVKYLI